MRHTIIAGLFFAILFGFLVPAHAQWTVAYLHPAGAAESWGTGVSGVDQVGRVTNAGSSNTFAALWTGTPASFVNMNPAGASASELDGTDGVHQVGSFVGNPAFHAYAPHYAGMWSGTAASVVNLQPTTGGIYEPWSHALAVQGSLQVGDYQPSTEPIVQNAATWSGTSASYAPLSSTGLPYTAALGTNGVNIVGYSSTQPTGPSHASFWLLGISPSIDLSPAGSTSSVARGVAGVIEVGSATFGGAEHAAQWASNASSFLDLNPLGAASSVLNSVTNNAYEAGTATFGSTPNAGFWHLSSGSFVNLQQFLTPGTYSSSQALAIWSDGTTIKIVGSAFNSVLGRNEAVMWTTTVPEPSAFAALTPLCIAAMSLRRRKT